MHTILENLGAWQSNAAKLFREPHTNLCGGSLFRGPPTLHQVRQFLAPGFCQSARRLVQTVRARPLISAEIVGYLLQPNTVIFRGMPAGGGCGWDDGVCEEPFLRSAVCALA